MKCNNCLKIIPEGEEIRVYGGRGYSSKYGGCYCEPCWKETWEYKHNESVGKSSKRGGFPTWGIILIVGVVILIIILLVIWLINKDEDKYRYH